MEKVLWKKREGRKCGVAFYAIRFKKERDFLRPTVDVKISWASYIIHAQIQLANVLRFSLERPSSGNSSLPFRVTLAA